MADPTLPDLLAWCREELAFREQSDAPDTEEVARFRALAALLEGMQWRPIAEAPKDGTPILAWCDHEADPHHGKITEEGHETLTLYAAHWEDGGFAPTGYHIVEWGGAWDDSTWEYPDGANLPDWWFVVGSEFEIAANPTHFMPLPPPPQETDR